jgi:hypothetical protein
MKVPVVRKYLVYKARNKEYDHNKPDNVTIRSYESICNYVLNYEKDNPSKKLADSEIDSAWESMKQHFHKNRPNNSKIVEKW